MVLVADECRVERESGLQHIWYQKGKYPTIRVDQKKEAVSFYGALDVKTGECHIRDSQWQSSKETVQFLIKLGRIYKGKKVLLVWDGAPSHRGEVKDFLAIKDKKWHLELMCFPPYSPDLNPQEKVWKEARKHITHNSEEEFEDKVYAFFKFIQSTKFKTNFLQKYA